MLRELRQWLQLFETTRRSTYWRFTSWRIRAVPAHSLALEFGASFTRRAMTEYWVSQGKKWCEYCKVFIANNATSLRNHEVGQRHKKSMAEKLAQIRKDNIAKEKEKQQALKEQERIEQIAKRERENAAAERLSQRAARPPEAPGGAPPAPAIPASRSSQVGSKSEGNVNEWVYDERSGYHFNAATGYYYDPNSGLYYSDILGKWTTQEEAHLASQKAHAEAGVAPATSTLSKQPSSTKDASNISSNATILSHAKTAAEASTAASQEPVPKQKSIPNKGGKGVASSLEVKKRRIEEKPVPVSSEEAAALAAREAAKKRVLDREKSLMGLYQAY